MASEAAERELRPRTRRRRAATEASPGSVLFRSSGGARARRIKTGFAWDLFLFVPVFGAPLFLRGLPHWGAAILALWLGDLALGFAPRGALWGAMQVLLFAAFLGLQAWLGWKGNALTARACRARGWTVVDARDAGVKRALARWGIEG